MSKKMSGNKSHKIIEKSEILISGGFFDGGKKSLRFVNFDFAVKCQKTWTGGLARVLPIARQAYFSHL
jgi:hypothetical protein